jgi:hypothetical protein
MIIKAGTIGTWNTQTPANYSAKPGARVIVLDDFDDVQEYACLINVKWIDELAAGETGRQGDGGYFVEDFIWEEEPEVVYDVNKTVEVAVATSELGDYIIIGQLLQTLPISRHGNLFTRPFLQDGCYCAYGWTVSESNEAIDLCVEKGLFKLI